MSRPFRFLVIVVGVYAFAWVAYVAKSAAGINVFRDGVHHGPAFPGSDRVVAKLLHA